MAYILGLDLGPNSIGWACVEADSEEGLEPLGLLSTEHAGHGPLGVRVFEAGLDKFDTAKEASRNQKRRQARAARRTLSRRRARKEATREVLTSAGLLPEDPRKLEEVWRIDPYEVRARALEERLSPEELGRALYHLAQRRGFKSNRLSGDPKEEQGLLKEISRLQSQIDESEARTLGEFLFRQKRSNHGELPPRLRARVAGLDHYEDAPRRTRRSMYEDEFKRILQAQERFWEQPPLDAERYEALHKALFFQHDFRVTPERKAKAPSRANLHRAPGVKPCPYEEGERGCPRSDWLAQRFRILKDVQNLRVSEEHGPERPLTDEEVRFCVETLSANKQKSFSALGKDLVRRFGLREPIEFNLARGGRSGLKGNEIEATLAGAFGKKAWAALDEEERVKLREALVDAEGEEEFERSLRDAGLTDEAKIAKLVSFRPKDDGYLGFSRKALEKILPLMEEGLNEYDAISEAYPQSFSGAGLDFLPSLVAIELDPKIRASVHPTARNAISGLTNPVVRRALVEVRKVVNALIREHGKPDRIVVELAREMKQGREQRRELSKKNNERNRLREEARRQLRELLGGGAWPQKRDVDRYLLWKEQNCACPYCGRAISQEQVANADIEEDHILPRWQSLDDSMNNRVLACSTCNAAKGDRTPLQWLGRESGRAAAMLKRVRACQESKANPGGMPAAKVRRFEQEEVDPDGFASSQLNDTRYISRLVSDYLLALYPSEDHVGQKRVLSSRGGLTAKLRREWGLNDVIPPLPMAHGEVMVDSVQHEGWTEKLRVDHRHHAVDALVVALSSRSLLKRYQDAFRRGEQEAVYQVHFDPPWPTIRADAQRAVAAIRVSHRPMRRLRGALHEETYYGKARGEDGVYVTRKRLEDLTPKMIEKIRDKGVRRAIEARLSELGWEKGASLPKDWWREPLYLPTKRHRGETTPRKPHPIWRVRIVENKSSMIPLGKSGEDPHRYAVPGSNHCLEVIQQDGEETPLFRVVPRFEAYKRGSAPLQPGQRLLGRLYRKDSVLVRVAGLEEPILAVVQTISGSLALGGSIDIRIRDARDSREATVGNSKPLLRAQSQRAWQAVRVTIVTVDPLGRPTSETPLFCIDPTTAQVPT